MRSAPVASRPNRGAQRRASRRCRRDRLRPSPALVMARQLRVGTRPGRVPRLCRSMPRGGDVRATVFCRAQMGDPSGLTLLRSTRSRQGTAWALQPGPRMSSRFWRTDVAVSEVQRALGTALVLDRPVASVARWVSFLPTRSWCSFKRRSLSCLRGRAECSLHGHSGWRSRRRQWPPASRLPAGTGAPTS